MRGTLYGIGVGPGDPELMTIKALRMIQKSDVLILPSAPKETCYAYQIACMACPQAAQKEVVCMPFPMTKNQEKLLTAHQVIYDTIDKLLKQGKNVGFLTIGDPCIYATYGYLHKREQEQGNQPVVLNGVPSFCAAAAALGIMLAEGNEQIHIIPASYELEESLRWKGTRIYMKSGHKLGELKRLLEKHLKKEQYEVYGVENCGMVNEKLMKGLAQIDTDSGYLTLVIVKDRRRE